LKEREREKKKKKSNKQKGELVDKFKKSKFYLAKEPLEHNELEKKGKEADTKREF